MKPTMADVSRRSGLSIWTVSQVLNGKSGVSEKSRLAVQDAAAHLGYVVNSAARDLKRNRRSGISVITASTENSYYVDLVQGVHTELLGTTHTAMVSDIASKGHYSQEAEDQTIESVLGTRPAGLITTLPLSEKNLDLLERWEVLVVFVDSPLPAGSNRAASVTTDNLKASGDLGDHLGLHGYRNWVAVMYPSRWPTRAPRVQGLRDAAQRNGASLTVLDAENDMTSAAAALSDHLDSGSSPDAIIAGNNPLLRGVMGALATHSLRAPQDLGLVSFDEFAWAPLTTPTMTLIDEDAALIGRQAAALLLDLIERRETSTGATAFTDIYKPQDQIVMPAKLTIRESCGCPS